MGGELELYQQQIDTAFKPVLERLESYRKAMFEIKKLLVLQFFDEARTKNLTESAQVEQVVFDFKDVKESMEKCLVDENELVVKAQEMQGQSGNPSLVRALDANVLGSGLPIKLQENGLYHFNNERNYTPKAQAFMQQFAYALTAYRMCLGVCEVYFTVLYHQGIQTEEHKKYLESANQLKQLPLDGAVDLHDLLRQAKKIKREINELLHPKQVRQGLETYKDDIIQELTKFTTLFETGADHLQACYKQFPNHAKLWPFHEDSLHNLLRTLSSLLYVDKYTASIYQGTLTINLGIIEELKKEIDQFSSTAPENTRLLRIELLKKAGLDINTAIGEIRAKAAEKDVELIEAPQEMGVFGALNNTSVYHWMSAYRQRYEEESPWETESNFVPGSDGGEATKLGNL